MRGEFDGTDATRFKFLFLCIVVPKPPRTLRSKPEGRLLGDMHYAGVPRRKFMIPEKSAAAWPWALNNA